MVAGRMHDGSNENHRDDAAGERRHVGKATKRFGFDKALRLRRRQGFVDLARKGRKIHSPHFILNIGPNPEGQCRLGITVSKKVGGAVCRNRIKRVCREFFRQERHRIQGSWDINVIAKKSAADTGNRDLDAALRLAFKCVTQD